MPTQPARELRKHYSWKVLQESGIWILLVLNIASTAKGVDITVGCQKTQVQQSQKVTQMQQSNYTCYEGSPRNVFTSKTGYCSSHLYLYKFHFQNREIRQIQMVQNFTRVTSCQKLHYTFHLNFQFTVLSAKQLVMEEMKAKQF